MKKIVINDDYGGYGLSYKAMMRYAELKGFKLYAYTNPPPGFKSLFPYDGTSEAFVIFYYKQPISGNAEEDSKAYFSDDDISRDDPILIQVIEELGTEANGYCATLKIIEIPDDVEWVIEEYDGNEWVAEKHRIWS